MTIEEKIKEDWGEYWDFFNYNTQKRILENNGSVDYFLLSKEEKEDTEVLIGDIRKLECTKTDEGTARYFRPKSLKGIENNNGWKILKLNTELKEGKYHVFCNGRQDIMRYFQGYFYDYDQKYKPLSEVTHYDEYIERKPPIF